MRVPTGDPFERPILVLGLPRSGTSLVAGLLARCGLWTGTTVPGGSENPKGFYENTLLREKVVKQILARSGFDPRGADPLPPPGTVLRVPGLVSFVRSVIELDGYAHDRPWLFKDPKLTLLWPTLKEAFPSARWVITRRDPEAVIGSCLRAPFLRQHSSDPAFWHGFVEAYQERLQGLQKSGAECYEIDSDRLIKGAREQLLAVLEALGLDWDESAARGFIEPGAWHDGATGGSM